MKLFLFHWETKTLEDGGALYSFDPDLFNVIGRTLCRKGVFAAIVSRDQRLIAFWAPESHVTWLFAALSAQGVCVQGSFLAADKKQETAESKVGG